MFNYKKHFHLEAFELTLKYSFCTTKVYEKEKKKKEK